MDERQAQIREGAGLDEARLNVEFIDFLKRWSTPVLVIVALVAVGYFLMQKRTEWKDAALAEAFVELDAARTSGSPAGLLAVADTQRGRGAVSQIAELAAADVFLASYRSGLRPGAQVNTAGVPEDTADIITSREERGQQLDQAAKLYQQVLDETAGKTELAAHAVGALYGLAAVAESRQKFDEARGFYERIGTLARTADMPEHVELAKHRIDTLGTLGALPRVYNDAEIPKTMMGSLPEGFTQIPAPNRTPTTQAPAQDTPPGPVGPPEPVAPPVVNEPETANPSANPPAAEPGGKPPEKPGEKPADPASPAPPDKPKDKP